MNVSEGYSLHSRNISHSTRAVWAGSLSPHQRQSSSFVGPKCNIPRAVVVNLRSHSSRKLYYSRPWYIIHIYNRRRRMRTHTVVLRSTQLSTHHGTANILYLSNNNKWRWQRWMVAAYGRTRRTAHVGWLVLRVSAHVNNLRVD